MAKKRKPGGRRESLLGWLRIEVLANKMMKPAIGCDFATVLCAIARILDDIGYQSHKVLEARDD